MIPITFYLYFGINYVLTTVYRNDSGYDKVRIGTSSLSTAAALCLRTYCSCFCDFIPVRLRLQGCPQQHVAPLLLEVFQQCLGGLEVVSGGGLVERGAASVVTPDDENRFFIRKICYSRNTTSPALSRTRRRPHLRRRIFPVRI